MPDTIPHNREAEEALLGAVLLNPACWLDVAYIRAEDFYNHRHRWIWEAVSSLKAANRAVDLVTVADELGTKLEEAGGPAYLTQLISAVPSALHALEYAELVAEAAASRRLIQIGEELGRAGFAGESPDSVIARMLPRLSESASRRGKAEKISGDAVLDQFLERIAEPVDVWGIRTGFDVLDSTLGGAQRGEVILIAGEPGVGKTTLVAQMGFQMAGLKFWPGQLGDEVSGAIYSMEMQRDTIVRRAACAIGHVGWSKVMSGKASSDEQKSFQEALGKVHDSPVFISDDTHWTSVTMRADVARLAVEEGIGWVVVDYAGCLKDAAGSDYEREVMVSIAMHDIAKDFDVAVILVDALNKQGFYGNRSLGALRGAGAKAYDADVVAFLTAERQETKHGPMAEERILVLRKAREGDMSKVLRLYHRGDEKRLEPALARVAEKWRHEDE